MVAIDLRQEVFALAKDKLKTENCVLLELATGVGKTKLALDLAKDYGVENVVVLVPTDAVGDAWMAEVRKWKSQLFIQAINYVSAHKVLEMLIMPDLVIMDEAHHITERNLSYISKYNVPLIALSATVDWEKMQLLKTLGFQRGITVSLDKASEHELISEYEMTVITFPPDGTTRSITAGTKAKPFSVTEVQALAYAESRIGQARRTGNKQSIEFAYINRMRLIRTLPSRIEIAKKMVKRLQAKFPNEKILVFAPDIAQCEAIVPDCFYHSKSGPEGFDAFKAGTQPVLGSVNALSEGINVIADIAVIVAGMSKERHTIQRLGRLLRKTSEGKVGKAFLLVARGTQDETWMTDSLASLSVVKYYRSESLGL